MKTTHQKVKAFCTVTVQISDLPLSFGTAEATKRKKQTKPKVISVLLCNSKILFSLSQSVRPCEGAHIFVWCCKDVNLIFTAKNPTKHEEFD